MHTGEHVMRGLVGDGETRRDLVRELVKAKSPIAVEVNYRHPNQIAALPVVSPDNTKLVLLRLSGDTWAR